MMKLLNLRADNFELGNYLLKNIQAANCNNKINNKNYIEILFVVVCKVQMG